MDPRYPDIMADDKRNIKGEALEHAAAADDERSIKGEALGHAAAADDENQPIWPTWAVGVISDAQDIEIRLRTPVLEVSQGASQLPIIECF
jgi:hypothetical protein